MKRLLAAVLRDGKAATAVEYGLIIALIVVGIMAGLFALGGDTQALWGNLHTRVASVSPK